jgi:hypothetical protein
MLIAACSGDGGESSSDNAKSLPLPDVIDPRPFTRELEHDGRWDIFRVPSNGRVVGIVDAGDGAVAVIANPSWDATRPKGERRQPTALRFYELEGNRWDPITDWKVPSADTTVRWRSVSVLDGSIVVTRYTPEEGGPVSVVFDSPADPQILAESPVDGPEQLDHTIAGANSILGISLSLFKDEGSAAVWNSPDGLRWDDATPTEGWPKDTVRLSDLAYSDGIWAIGARRRQGRVRTDFVMTSRDAFDWQSTRFNTAGGTDGIRELERLGSDGSTLLALGSDQAGDLVTQTSTDGTTWSQAQPVEAGVFGDTSPKLNRIVSHPDGRFLAGRAGFNSDYRHCYVAGRACGVQLEMVWVAHNGTWLPIAAPTVLDISAVALIDGTLYVGGSGAIATWIPEEPATIPVAVMPVDEPPQFDRPIASCSTLARGITYTWAGCEDCAYFKGFHWEIDTVTDDAAAILAESGAVAPAGSWGVLPGEPEARWGAVPYGPVIYGTIELISSDRIEWSIPGYGPIAYLRPGDPLTGAGIDGCYL